MGFIVNTVFIISFHLAAAAAGGSFLGQVLVSPVGEDPLIIGIKHRSVVCVQVSAAAAVNLDQILSRATFIHCRRL